MKYLLTILLCTACYLAVAQQKITPQEAVSHIGDSLTVCGKVFGEEYLQKGKHPYITLNVGAAYPNSPFTAVVHNQAMASFTKAPEAYYVNSTVCFTGRVAVYNGKPQMIIYRPAQMSGAINDKLLNEPE